MAERADGAAGHQAMTRQSRRDHRASVLGQVSGQGRVRSDQTVSRVRSAVRRSQVRSCHVRSHRQPGQVSINRKIRSGHTVSRVRVRSDEVRSRQFRSDGQPGQVGGQQVVQPGLQTGTGAARDGGGPVTRPAAAGTVISDGGVTSLRHRLIGRLTVGTGQRRGEGSVTRTMRGGGVQGL